jgi:diadenosine tetraphosphate (Ap4A) HIT family hydrolase
MSQSSSIIVERVEAARRGENPTAICRMASGWAVMCDWQKLPGYTILIADPLVSSLNDADELARQMFLKDMVTIGEVLLKVTDAIRINYQILGNLDPYLHAHICPRYSWEEPRLLRGVTAMYDKSGGPFFDLKLHGPLMDRIRAAITSRQ